MIKRGGFSITMAERVAFRTGVDPCPTRQCWILKPADHPGFDVSARCSSGGTPMRTCGRVIYPAQLRPASG